MTEPAPVDIVEISRCEALATVYSRLLSAAVVNVFNAALLVLVISDGRATRGALEWLGLLAAVSVTRIIIYYRYRADPHPQANHAYWQAVAVGGSFVSGLLWGIGPVLPFSDFTEHFWFWAFVIGGMTSGATSLYAAHLPTALSFTVPAVLPLALALVLQDTLQGYAAAIMILAFIATMTFTAVLFSREFARARELKLTLQLRAGELDEANRSLTREIESHRDTSEALLQSRKMDALGNFTGGFAHDFSNILTVVINHLEVIASRSGEAPIKKLAQTAIDAATSGADLLARLLAFARKQSLAPTHVDIVATVAEFRALLSHAVSGAVHVDFDLDCPATAARIDVPQFHAMLLNLVANARDAMMQGGLIRVSASRVTIDPGTAATDVPPGAYAAIAVRDEGPGMAPDTLARVFEPYFTTKADSGGTGLGLSQVYGFVRQSGGHVRIESEVGRGTCVTVFIPQADDLPDARRHHSPTDAAPKRDYALLLVDDNEAVLQAMTCNLAEEGWRITNTNDPHAALEMVAAGGFDIVVTDVNMPGPMDGKQLARELRHRHPDLPILLMSGAASDGDAGDGAEFPFIAKPFRKAALLRRVRALVE